MRFALLKNERIEATKGTKGVCPCCGNDLVAKCGEVYIHHWAHKKKCDDYWWENETEWHRNWKNKFPKEWQEVIHRDESGEKHIADVKTSEGWAIEFQHSYIEPEERRSRDNFYKKLIWVVDGTRRKTDVKKFQKVLNEVWLDKPSRKLLYVNFPDWSKLLMEWKDSNSLILLDFKDRFSSNDDLWLIYPRMYQDDIYLSQISRITFIEYLNNNKFDEIVDKIINPIRITVEHSIKENEKRSLVLAASMRHTEWLAQPESYLGTLKLPYGILSKIDIQS
jgi:competence CoiA-like predicted nuclease